MDKKRDLRRTAIPTINDDEKQMELVETVRLIDREQLHRRERDGKFFKKRIIHTRSEDSSDEEYLEEENDIRIHQQNRTNQLPPAFFPPVTNHRDLPANQSSPMLRNVVDEVIGVPVPRRARSASAKKLDDYQNSGNGGFGYDLSHRRFPPSPVTVSPISSGGVSPTSSGASLKKKMKCIEPRTPVLSGASDSRPSLVIQDDIEIEVAEALFDLMTQSHSQSQSSKREEKVDRDSTNAADDVVKRLKAAPGKDENDASKVQNEQIIQVNADTICTEKEKFTDGPAQELVIGDGFVDGEKAGSPKESESSSCIKVDAFCIQDPTVTKADCAASAVEAKDGARMEIDLMALPSVPSSPERDALHDIDPKVMTPDVQKKSETIGAISGNQMLNLNLEKEPQIQKDQKNKSPTPSSSFPIGMSSSPSVVSHPGLMRSHRTVLPINVNARSSMTVQTPQFKFTQPRNKRSTTHRSIAGNIRHHQQLVMKSLSSGHTDTAATLFGTKPLSLKSMLPTQGLVPGRDKGSDVAADFNATTSGKPVLQQELNQALAHNNLLQHYHGFNFSLGHRQTTMKAPAGPLPPQSAASSISNLSLPSNNQSGKLTPNSSLPEALSSSYHHPLFPSNEAAASYMAMLQNAGCSFPIPTNMFSNSSFYSSPAFNMSQKNASHNKLYSPQPEKNGASNINSSRGQAYSFTAQPMKFGAVAPPTNNKKHGDLSHQGSNNRAELSPRPFPSSQNSSSIFQMLPEYSWNGNNNTNKNIQMSEGVKSHLSSGSKTDSSAHALGFLPSSSLSSVAIPKFYHQMQQQLKGGSSVQTDYSSFLPKWDNNININKSNFLRNTTAPDGSSSSQSFVNIPKLKTNHHVTLGNNNPALIHGTSSSSRNTSSGQRNAASTVLVSTSQEDGSRNGLGQKASPACRTVLPSMLSTSANQLSEIKYG